MLYWSGILTVILVNMIEAKHELWVGAVFDYLAMGRRVRDKREALELTQSQLAKEVGVSASFIGHIERGEKKASLETIVSLANALETNLDYLTLGKKERCDGNDCPLYRDIKRLVIAYK